MGIDRPGPSEEVVMPPQAEAKEVKIMTAEERGVMYRREIKEATPETLTQEQVFLAIKELCEAEGRNPEQLVILADKTRIDDKGNLFLFTANIVSPEKGANASYAYAAKGEFKIEVAGEVLLQQSPETIIVREDDVSWPTEIAKYKNGKWVKT